MKIRTLKLNSLNKEDFIKIKSNSVDKNTSSIFNISSKKNISNINNNYHIKEEKEENKKDIPQTIFKNNVLLKSLSINTSTDFKLPRKKNHFFPFSPKINHNYKFKTKNGSKFINYINDENFFYTGKKNKRFFFPKQNYIIKKSRINHDINFFNLRNVITDHTKEYEKNSYKIKRVVSQDIFVNKIKNDLLRMKFGNQIKLFDNL